MPRSDKKQRHKAKREAKRLAARRRDSISPVKRLANAPGEVECWMSDDFKLNGQMQLFVYKRAAGLAGIACFLVDRGVVGLKDAWTQMEVDREQFANMLNTSKDRGIRMRRAAITDVRHWVAGGIRWAHDNGMRLPKDWIKAASLIGGVGEWKSADVSEFAREFAGHPEDLRQRLVSEPLETYLKRTDIDFIFSDDAPYMDQRTGHYTGVEDDLDSDDTDADTDEDEVDAKSLLANLPEEDMKKIADRFLPTATALAAETAGWLNGQNKVPSPELPKAWHTIMLAKILANADMPDETEKDEQEVTDFSFDVMKKLSFEVEPSRRAEYERAFDQAMEHLQTDPHLMRNFELKHGSAEDESDEDPADR